MKSLHLSLEASLKKLRTTYVDILYLHWVSHPPVLILRYFQHIHDHPFHSGTTRPASKRS